VTGRDRARGFTLLEVVIALAILAVSLVMLLSVNAHSLSSAGRARDLSVASLLARSKLIDLELLLNDEGFPTGELVEEGDFAEEGHKEITWQAKITEVEMTLDGLLGLCEGFAEESEMEEGGAGCAGMFESVGVLAEPFLEKLSNSMRVVELTVSWPVGTGFRDNMRISALVTREDLALQEVVDQQRNERQVEDTLRGDTEL
jgi:type II secretion system protein I